MLSKFDVAVLKAPEPWKSAAIEVCDTLHVVNMACQDEFGEAATPELVWTITKAVLARADTSVAPKRSSKRAPKRYIDPGGEG